MRISHAFVIAAGLSWLAQQAAPPPGLPQAMARLQAQDPAGALAIAEQVVVREPANARAWRVLGVAAKGTKDLERAMAAFQKSIELEPANPVGLYNTGVIYALKGDRDRAFEWLGKAKGTRKIDMTQIQPDADLVSLHGDPRFAALLPSPADFVAPFVEDVKILREWDGEAMNDQFGWIARPIGDVDRDGITDIVTSAPGTPGPGTTAPGHVYLYSTKTGKLVWKADGEGNDRLGTGVEGAGDTNKDGVPDVIASAPGSGRAYVYSGKDGHVLLTMKAENAADNFGAHASGVGDVNGDGYDDVIVGAPGNAANGAGAGRAYVYSGKDGTLLLTLSGEHPGDGFGAAVAGGKRGSRVFLIVGAPGAGARRPVVRLHVVDAEARVRHRGGRDRRRARRDVPVGPRRRRRRQDPGHLCLRLFERRERPVDRPHLRALGQRRTPAAHAHRRRRRRGVRDRPRECRRREPRWS